MDMPPDQVPTSRPATDVLKQSHTEDFDEQATLLQGWNQHYAQLSAGRFRGAIVELFLDDVHLFSESTNQALLQRGKIDEDVLALGIPLQVVRRGLFCGESMRDNAIHVFTGADGFEFYSPARLTMGGIVVSRAALQQWMQADIPPAGTDLPTRLKTVSAPLLREARAFLFATFDLCKHHPALLLSAPFRRRLRDAVLACAADLITNGDSSYDPPSGQRRWKLVQQVQECLYHMPDSTLSIEGICSTVGVSRRTLQYCFNDLMGINPVAFLRAQRLNGARQMLKESRPVTEAATTWGFWHFGHFSQEYKKLFGELPSETLRRSGSAADG